MKAPNYYRRAQFLKGVHALKQLPPEDAVEVAIAGRSNAGKSSALNALTDNRALARISKTPGRTQQINYFVLDETRRLVDLPGYGYAKVPERVRRHWQATLGRFLETRKVLRGLVLVMDVRHPLTPHDDQMLLWCRHAGMPVHILLTKADKLKRGPATAALHQVRHALEADGERVSVQLFSAQTRQGVEEVRAILDRWYEVDGDHPG